MVYKSSMRMLYRSLILFLIQVFLSCEFCPNVPTGNEKVRYVDQGFSVMLGGCKFIKDPTKVLWFQNGFIVMDSTSSITLKENNYKERILVIQRMTQAMTGLYVCCSSETTDTQAYRIYIKDKPTISDETNSTMTVTEGDSVDIWCNSSSFTPEIATEWFLKETETENGKQRIGISGRKLQIVNITRECAAKYRCEATNSIGTSHKEFDITVQYKPIISIRVGNMSEQEIYRVQVEENDFMVITCHVNCVPPPFYMKWQLNGEVVGYWNNSNINTSDKYKRYVMLTKQVNSFDMKLQTKKVKNADKFTCKAKNNIGEITKTVSVKFI